jgi:hypothetical protein
MVKFGTSEGFTGRRSYVNFRIEELRIKTLYGCGTCSVTVLEKRVESPYKNSVLRKVIRAQEGRGDGGLAEIAQ